MHSDCHVDTYRTAFTWDNPPPLLAGTQSESTTAAAGGSSATAAAGSPVKRSTFPWRIHFDTKPGVPTYTHYTYHTQTYTDCQSLREATGRVQQAVTSPPSPTCSMADRALSTDKSPAPAPP